MRQTLTEKILEVLIDGAATSLYLFAAIVASPYGASQKQMERKFWELQERGGSRNRPKDFSKQRNNFYSLLSQLKKDELIESKNRKWGITFLGKEKHKTILKGFPPGQYEKEKDSNLKIFIFDIPEKEKYKRKWLRGRLSELGFKMLQKSVWAGRVKVPKEFIEDLRDLKLLQYIEIFAVTKSGSLRKID
ncbi:MAG: CRISPR-associated endonuclease Cas2 [bacterium]|nr:CRISPR-associated endonuclease Cas2 [bacterium]